MRITVKDNDTLVIVADVPPSVADPEHIHPAVGRVYRVIATSSVPLLELVSIGSAVRITGEERDSF